VRPASPLTGAGSCLCSIKRAVPLGSSGARTLIEDVAVADLDEIRALIATAIRTSVTDSESEAEFLIGDVESSLRWWQAHPAQAIHLKYLDAGQIAGVVLVKDFWNLTNLFVLPGHQRRGIGRALVQAVVGRCAGRSPRAKIQLNSSTYAVPFYNAVGFTQTGPGRDQPGGCVPFEYRLSGLARPG